jgi:outer membrane protein assembly factor BamA
MVACLLTACLCVGIATTSTQPFTVSRIIIVGNTRTNDNVIRDCVNIFPGQQATFKDLRAAAKGLVRLGIFNVDPEKGIRPTVTAIPTDDPAFYDILIRVKEAQP